MPLRVPPTPHSPGGTRRSWAGPPRAGLRCDCSPGRSSMCWSCPPRPVTPCCGAVCAPAPCCCPVRGWGCWSPRAAPMSCRGCSTGWNGARSRWTWPPWVRGPRHGPASPGRPGRLAGGRCVAAAPRAEACARAGAAALAGFGSSGGDAPDLVRLVDAAATECHRVRLSRARSGVLTRGGADQPLAFS